MKYTKYYLYLIFLILNSFSITIRAQNAISTTGGNVTGNGGSVSYTIGQILYSTLSGTNGTVVQGVQQPFEISVVTAIRNAEEINLEYLVYPNPTNGLTKLIFKSPDYENMSFQLYDINGVILINKKIKSMETEISLENFSSTIYLLKVFKNNFEIKVFKIVKR